MASRSLGPDPQSNPRSLGMTMRQGSDPMFALPHGLASSMKQGNSKADGAYTPGLGAAMKQGSKGKK